MNDRGEIDAHFDAILVKLKSNNVEDLLECAINYACRKGGVGYMIFCLELNVTKINSID